MADPYAQARATALALLRKKGRSVVVRRPSSTFDPIVGEHSSAGVQSGTFTAVGLPVGPTAERYVGSLVGKMTLEFYLAKETTGGFLPAPGDEIVWGGRTYSLIWVSDLDPAGTGTVFYRAFGQV